MTRFFPLYVRRSDGKREVVTSKGKEKNAPSSEQLDRTPNAKGIADYYREIAEDEPKHLDWRKKLAGMLMREIGGASNEDKAAFCVLESLPENYRLYEHIKSRALDKDGNPTQSRKNHAGGGHDRQDAYLYGHPSGPKKRFRSPGDFFPHLLWLATDLSGDPNNCACKICCPEEIDDKPSVNKEIKNAPAIKKEETDIKPKIQHPVVEIRNPPRNTTPQSTPTPQVNSPKAIASRTATPQTVKVQPAASPQIAPPQQQPLEQKPSPIPQPRSIDQQVDAQYNRFAFRQGEVVWFNRGHSWGLAAVIRRYIPRSAQEGTRNYVLQPLSHPLYHPSVVNVSKEDLLRPWLAWSPPNYIHKWLNDNPTTYDRADWTGLAQQRYGPGDCEVDGSILAARAVDMTYALLDFIGKTPTTNGEERKWNCLFFGGEKIWVGDPIRLRIHQPDRSSPVVMLLLGITERVEQRGHTVTSSIILQGDIYQLAKIEDAKQALPNDQAIPLRMREDARWINRYMMPTYGTRHFWRLTKAMSRMQITDLKGRWYESSFLVPLYHQLPAQLSQAMERGGLVDPGSWLNSRGDAGLTSTEGNVLRRTADRRDAFGKALPAGMSIMDGIEPPPISQQPPQQQQPLAPAPQQQPVQTHVQEDPMSMTMDTFTDAGQGGLDDFINLDGVDNNFDLSGQEGAHFY